MKKKVSQLFIDAMEETFTAGTCSISCGFCDRIHYSSDPSWDFEEGELESYEKDPNAVHHGYASVRWGYLDDKVYVTDCPCNSAKKYEDFIVENRHLIIRFLQMRAKEMSKIAQREKDLLNSLED